MEVIKIKKASYNIVPATEEILKTMGEQIKLARLRRNLSVELVAERAGISRVSLWNVEKGSPSVAIGIIKEDTAIKMAKEITETVKENWEKLAVKYGISRGKIEDMRPAFSECYK